MQVLRFFFIYILYCCSQYFISVTAMADLFSFTSCVFLQFDSPSFLINNILSSPEIFNLQLISPMF